MLDIKDSALEEEEDGERIKKGSQIYLVEGKRWINESEGEINVFSYVGLALSNTMYDLALITEGNKKKL